MINLTLTSDARGIKVETDQDANQITRPWQVSIKSCIGDSINCLAQDYDECRKELIFGETMVLDSGM